MAIKFLQGFCMALADSVPGVSGGTVAFILGFYERFISALHSLFGKDRTARRSAFLYLLKIGIGWAVGLVLSMLALSRLFEENIYFLSSLFLGLTLASIPFIIKEEKGSIMGRYRNLPFALLGLLAVCALTFFHTAASSGTVSYTALQPLQYGYLFLSGALAIMAMVLPGVSGSTLLLIMGVYLPTVNAVRALLHLDFSVFPGLIALIAGILAGAAFSAHSLRNALRKHRSQMIYLILGLMLGSLASIVVGPTTLSAPQEPLSFQTFQPLGFLLGIGILLALEGLKKLTAKKELAEQAEFMGAEADGEKQ